MNKDILIVDDEADIRGLIKAILEDEGYSVREAANSQKAMEAIETQCPDLAILDIWLQESDKDGIEILQKIKIDHPVCPVLMISGHGTIETAVNAIKLGAYDFIEKPFKSDRLIMMIGRALEVAELRKENQSLKAKHLEKDHQLLGQCSAIESLIQQIEKIAPTNSRVLITGKGGTGKEVVAQTIHKLSDRQNFSFMTINCATLAPDRLEKELFGVLDEHGEYHKGILELANKGTVFLDEVADMPVETQAKILRVLQDNEIFPVGGSKSVSIDVRFLSSTNKNLESLIESDGFREDLYYRLNVVALKLPTLKQRVDDIPLLTEYFLAEFAQQTGQPKRVLSKTALASLELYDWPGNVRQLKNMMEWLTIMSPLPVEKSELDLEDLPPEFNSSEGKAMNAPSNFLMHPLREAREGFEKTYLQAQIKRFNGNISKTAEFIGMERSALHRKLKTLDISLNDEQDSDSVVKTFPLKSA